MFLIDQIAEARIAEASQRGEFDNLPGAGRRQRLDDEPYVAPELRSAYRMLKNAGYLPPEVLYRREISEIEALLRLADTTPETDRARLLLRLTQLRAGIALRGHDMRLESDCALALVRRLTQVRCGRDGSN